MNLLSCNALLYALLSSTAIGQELEGRIYTADDRPEGDNREALVIQTIAYQHGTPARATANLVLFVPDLSVRIEGQEQHVAHTARLSYLSALLVECLRGLSAEGVGISLVSEHYFDVSEVRQHALSLGVSLLILPH